MTAAERQEIAALCQRAGQRLRQPELKATPQALDQDAEMERLKTLPAREPAKTEATPANNRLKVPDNVEKVMRGNAKSYAASFQQPFELSQLRSLIPSRIWGLVPDAANI